MKIHALTATTSSRIRPFRLVAMTALATLVLNSAHGGSTLTYSIPDVARVTDPITVSVALTSDHSTIAAVGARLQYDSARVSVSNVELGDAVPASWSLVYADSAAAGAIDVVVTDITLNAASMSTPTHAEVVNLTFSRLDASATPVNFSFSSTAPTTPQQLSAFPQNHYVINVGATVDIEATTTIDTSGPSVDLCLLDLTAPTVSCPPATTTAFTDASCQASVPDFVSGLTVSDNCTPAEDLVIVQTPAAATILGPGTHVVSVTVTDLSSNSTTCNIDFTVTDRSFLRGNVNARSSHTINITDLIELSRSCSRASP